MLPHLTVCTPHRFALTAVNLCDGLGGSKLHPLKIPQERERRRVRVHKGALPDGPDLAACEPAGQPARGGRAERLGQLAALGAHLAVQASAWVWHVQWNRQLQWPDKFGSP